LGEKHLAPGSEIPGAAHALGRVNTEVVRTLDTLDNNHIVAVLEPNRYGSLGFSRQFFFMSGRASGIRLNLRLATEPISKACRPNKYFLLFRFFS
jgi:hypothetical protein